MNQTDLAGVDEIIEHTNLLLDIAKEKLQDIQKAIRDPNFLKSSIKIKEMELNKKMDDIIRGQLEMRKMLKP